MILNTRNDQMKKNLILMLIALFTHTIVANSNIHQVLGISTSQQSKNEQLQLPKSTQKPIHLEKKLPNDPTLSRLLEHAKVKKTPQKEICCGIKMDYKLSKKLSLSVDLMAQVEEKSYKIKSKEANVHLAISL